MSYPTEKSHSRMILDLPVTQIDIPDTPTLGAYLAEILTVLLVEGDRFDPRAPLGGKYWEETINDALDDFPGRAVLNWGDLRMALYEALAGHSYDHSEPSA
jgi:hypothetical protein